MEKREKVFKLKDIYDLNSIFCQNYLAMIILTL